VTETRRLNARRQQADDIAAACCGKQAVERDRATGVGSAGQRHATALKTLGPRSSISPTEVLHPKLGTFERSQPRAGHQP